MKPKIRYKYYNPKPNKKQLNVNLMQQFNFTFCHRMPERSFFWKGKQFPVCARCTGIHIGYITFPLFMFSIFELNLLWTMVLIIPTYIDGLVQAYLNIESTNTRRLITGLMSGIGMMSLVSIIGKYIGNQILLLIN